MAIQMVDSIQRSKILETEMFLWKTRWLITGFLFFHALSQGMLLSKFFLILLGCWTAYHAISYLILTRFPASVETIVSSFRVTELILIAASIALIHHGLEELTFNGLFALLVVHEAIRGGISYLYPQLLMIFCAMNLSGWIIQQVGASISMGEVLRDSIYHSVLFLMLVLFVAKIIHSREMLEQNALSDSLTGLYNRRHFEEILDLSINCFRRKEAPPFTLLSIDIDDFKMINDRYGHVCGDMVLRAFAEVLRNTIRSEDSAFRVGGEEFAVLMPTGGTAGAVKIAERLRQNLLEEGKKWNLGEPLTISIGIATYGENTMSKEDFVHRADQALYEAKRLGKNRVMVLA